MKKTVLLIIAVLASLPIYSQVSKGLEAITKISCQAQLTFLSTDLMQGRKGGTAENHIASAYLYSLLSEMGYEPQYQNFKGKYGEDMRNVTVLIKGEDTTQYTVVGSHFDHLGVRYAEIYNGADDNASGAVAIIQIAKAIKASGLTPKRNIIMALWDGEEMGLLGSKEFVLRFADTASIVNYMNFDMIGRNSDEANPQNFTYFYTAAFPEFETWLRGAIADYSLGLKPSYNAWDNPVGGSDNASFAKIGVPICWYHTGGHADYHQPSDTADKINWNKMIDIIKSAYVVAWQMANK